MSGTAKPDKPNHLCLIRAKEWPLPDDPGAAIRQVDAPYQAEAFQK
jgi:hypothetical protein